MRKISADYIFPVSSPPVKDGVVVVDDNNVIIEVIPPPSPSSAGQDSEKYSGIIVPGFVNTHCHLELSHLQGQINEGKGLAGFISELISKRDKFPAGEINKAITSAEEEMLRNGIVGVGDISNTNHSFEQKSKKQLLYHTFIEAFDLTSDKAKTAFDQAVSLKSSNSNLPSSIVPHAPYTVSAKLIDIIDNLKQPFLSIHNQESAAENELFSSGSGALAEMMQKAGVDVDLKRRAKNPLLFILGALIESKKILLVHNTYTSKEDIELMKHYVLGAELEVALCLCPRANLYIENRLPDIPMLIEAGMKITLGTDSYASNWSLSVLEEMKTISKNFPNIPFDTLITWATKNGAEFLEMDKELGTIEAGKKPGLNLLTGINTDKLQLSDSVTVQKLV
jgi:cytosine/adenosine deaminase-related metal-dependent hydrolase